MVAAELERQLAEAGYETRTRASANFDASEIAEFAPDVAIFEMRGGQGSERVTLAHRLRAEAATYALPIIFLFHQDERTLRNAALSIGVDDYFALATRPVELRARLDALFWRAEAGRRAAPVVGEPHAEIDNFLLLLDTVRADIEDGAEGTLALAVAQTHSGAADAAASHPAERERLLNEAHGFLKLNLRRIDTVAFYGPTMLLIYLPGMTAINARVALMRAREKFLATRRESDIAIGLASFPSDGRDVENLFERAEASINKQREPTISTEEFATTSTAEVADISTPEVVDASTAEAVDTATPEVAKTSTPPVNETAVDETSVPEAEKSVSKAAAVSVIDDSLNDDSTLKVAGSRTAAGVESQAETVVEEASESASKNDAPREVSTEQKTDESRVAAVNAQATPKTEDSSATYVRPASRASHVVRETRTVETGALPVLVETGADGDQLARLSAEAGARERERRARGEVMPRRLLLTVSDPVRMAQVNLLIRAAGYEVRAAFDGQQALNLLRIERPDLLLLDYELHGIDGLETLRRLRKQNGGRLKLPVILLMPAPAESVRREALGEGARAVVGLPYDPVELLDAVRTAGTSE
jgi:DNA-binding response OmpR family regulator